MTITNWTQSGTSMEVSTETALSGTKSLKVNPITSGTKTLTSDRSAAVANQTYAISLNTFELLAAPNPTTLQCNVSEIAYVDSGSPTTNYHNINKAGGYASAAYRALYKFDFSGIPTGAKIGSAILSNTLTAVDSQGSVSLGLYRALASWTDSTVIWNTKPNNEPTGIGSMTLSATEANGIKTANLTTQYIQEILEGAFPNNGFMFIGNPEGTTTTTTTTYSRILVGYSNVAVWFYINGVLHVTTRREPDYENVPVVTTTTVGFNDSYTFNNTPYITVIYDATIHPNPNYTISINWYDNASAGSLLRSDVIATSNQVQSWNLRSLQVNSPAGTLSFNIVISATVSDAIFYVDNVSVKPIGYY
jgi:hypothetical protein